MKRLERISMIGLGAIGAAYGSKLYDMDPECLRVIVSKERAERYSKNGFIINNKTYNFSYVLPEEDSGPADLILVAVKYHDLPQAIEDIKNHVGPDTIIVSLMNGILSEEIIGKEYGMERMLYAMCLAIDAVREGNNIKLSSFGEIHFGEKKNTVYSSKVLAVKELFERAGINYEIPEDMLRTLWWKFMINTGINQTSAVLRAPYGVFCQVKEAYDFMVSTMEEVLQLSEKMGISLNEEDIARFGEVLKKLAPDGKTSMLQDIEAGRKTEVEMLSGTVCELGRKYGVSTPVNEALFRMIRTLEYMGKSRN